MNILVHYPHLNADIIAKTLMREKGFIEKILDRLIKKKLLRDVKNNGKDLHIKYYELTNIGKTVYQETGSRNDRMLAVLLKFISENELLTFTKTLLKIRNIIMSLN